MKAIKKSFYLLLALCFGLACSNRAEKSNEEKLTQKGRELGEYFCKMQTARQANDTQELEKLCKAYTEEYLVLFTLQKKLAMEQDKISLHDFMEHAKKVYLLGLMHTAEKCGLTQSEVESVFRGSQCGSLLF